MKKLLSLSILALSLTTFAQPDPMYSYGLPLRQIDAVPYDSIAVLDATNPSGAPLRWARYVFYQNSYVGGGQADNGQKQLSYGFALSGSNPVTFEMDQANGDTLRSILYLRGTTQDSAVKVFDHQSAALTKLSAHIKYFYTPAGELDSSYTINYRADTVWYISDTKNHFTGNRIDSVISGYVGNASFFKNIHFYNPQGRLQYTENYSTLTGSLSYSGRDTYIYNAAAQVEKIDQKLALPGGTTLVPFEQVVFRQSPTFAVKELGLAKLQVYPNPTSGLLKIELEDGLSEAFYQIVGLDGKTLKNGQTNGEVDLSGLPAGLYFLKVGSGIEIFTLKVRKL